MMNDRRETGRISTPTDMSDQLLEEIAREFPPLDKSEIDTIASECERRINMKKDDMYPDPNTRDIVDTVEVCRKTPWYRRPAFTAAASFAVVLGIGGAIFAGIRNAGGEPETEFPELPNIIADTTEPQLTEISADSPETTSPSQTTKANRPEECRTVPSESTKTEVNASAGTEPSSAPEEHTPETTKEPEKTTLPTAIPPATKPTETTPPATKPAETVPPPIVTTAAPNDPDFNPTDYIQRCFTQTKGLWLLYSKTSLTYDDREIYTISMDGEGKFTAFGRKGSQDVVCTGILSPRIEYADDTLTVCYLCDSNGTEIAGFRFNTETQIGFGSGGLITYQMVSPNPLYAHSNPNQPIN